MTKEKSRFVQEYINKLEEQVVKYDNCDSECIQAIEGELFDCILEIRNVFKKDLPEIEDAILIRQGTGKRDANSVIGILKVYLLDDIEKGESDKQKLNKIDELKRLKTEFAGIKSTLLEYSSNGNVENHLNQLEIGFRDNDMELIRYCLNELSIWYDNNIGKIDSNEYCFNKDEHRRNMNLIIEFKESLKTYEVQQNKNSVIEKINKSLVFLSHQSGDKKFGDALERFIVGLGVKNNQLIYTSHPLHKIPMDKNIYDYLRENISKEIFMIILWSNTYLESPACLNEMGAAWVTQSDYTNIYVPNFSFGNPKYHECAVDTKKMGAVLNGDAHCKASLIELKNKIVKMFKLEIDETLSLYLIDQFINEIKEN